MSQIRTPSLVPGLLLLLLVFVLSGCGDKNSNVTLDSSTGKHSADWVVNHWVQFKPTIGTGAAATASLANSTCTQCHGADLLGGISKVSCFSAAIGGQSCHTGGPSDGHGAAWGQASQHGRLGALAAPGASAGFAYCSKCHGSNFNNGNAVSCYSCHSHTSAPHPSKPWNGTTASGSNHVFTDPANADQCAKCHTGGEHLTSLQKPPVQPAGTAPGCFNNTLCHGAGHIAGWSDPTSLTFHSIAATTSSASCAPCHGATLDGGVSPSGTAPSCSTLNSSSGLHCHSNGKPTGSKATGCTSCHGNPPDGSTAPNIKLSHDRHGNIPVVTCTACHNGAGSGTLNHATGTVNVSLLASYKAKKSASNPVYNANGTCANVSCHGGNTTPVWGSANGLTCSACHEQGSAYQVPEYNSYYSGTFLGINLHSYHLAQTNPGTVTLITCTNCHDSAKLTKQQHFGGLAARSFVFPGNTIGGVNTRMGRYDTSARTCSTVSCHSLVPQNNIGWFNF